MIGKRFYFKLRQMRQMQTQTALCKNILLNEFELNLFRKKNKSERQSLLF